MSHGYRYLYLTLKMFLNTLHMMLKEPLTHQYCEIEKPPIGLKERFG